MKLVICKQILVSEVVLLEDAVFLEVMQYVFCIMKLVICKDNVHSMFCIMKLCNVCF
jgi:hypothetical protein